MQHAWTHIQEIETAIGEWSNSEPVSPYTECYPRNDKFTYWVRARVNRNPPDDLGIVIGKAVHQMRAALDNSISLLAPPRFRNSTSFPILLAGDKSTLLSLSGIDALPAHVVQFLDSIQPYNASDRAQRKAHPLHVLNELWNEDKHRTIPLLSMSNTFGMIDLKPGEEVTSSAISRIVYEGAILMKVISPHPEREVDPHFSFSVAFESAPASKRNVETVLIDCHHLTKDILTKIVPGFTFDYPKLTGP